MITNLLEAVIMAILSILIMSGAGFLLWWSIDSTKRFCSNSDCCKKKLRWECKKCGDVVSSDTQPFCKTCGHIERINVKMDRLENR